MSLCPHPWYIPTFHDKVTSYSIWMSPKQILAFHGIYFLICISPFREHICLLRHIFTIHSTYMPSMHIHPSLHIFPSCSTHLLRYTSAFTTHICFLGTFLLLKNISAFHNKYSPFGVLICLVLHMFPFQGTYLPLMAHIRLSRYICRSYGTHFFPWHILTFHETY